MLLLIVVMVVTYLARLGMPWLLGKVIDETLTQGLRGEQLRIAAIILLLGTVMSVAGYFEAVLHEFISVRSAEDLRNDLFRKLLHLSFGYYDRQRTGDLMSRVTSDLDQLRVLFVTGSLRMLSAALHAGVIGYFIAATNWRLIVIAAMFTGVFAWIALQRSGRLKELNAKLQFSRGTMAAALQENIAGMRVVKSFGAGEAEEKKFDEEAAAVLEYGFAVDRFWATRTSMQLFITTATLGVVVWFGGREIVAGRLTAGELTTFIIYLSFWQKSVTTLLGIQVDPSSGPHHQDSGESKIRESTAGGSRKPSSDGKACGCSSKHLCGLTAWNT